MDKCEDYEEKRNNYCNLNENNRKELLNEIKGLNFSIIELGLYLDTHPEDQKALYLHREYAKQLEELKNKYQKMYGPLTIFYPCNKWKWIESPWPWEG